MPFIFIIDMQAVTCTYLHSRARLNPSGYAYIFRNKYKHIRQGDY